MMWSSSFTKTLIRSSTRLASRNWRTPPKRTYATDGPPMSHGGHMRPIVISFLAGTPILAYFLIPGRAPEAMAQEIGEAPQANLDPAGKKRAQKEQGAPGSIGGTKYMHPEHLNPEEFKPAFGIKHKQKRVDGAPDGRNHQALSDRARRE